MSVNPITRFINNSIVKQSSLMVFLSLATGGALGFWFYPSWTAYKAQDSIFICEFRKEPIEMGLPKPAAFSFAGDQNLKIYSIKGDWGVDEINRLDELTSPDAAAEWFEQSVRQTGGKLITGDRDDFTLFLPDEKVYMRGRIVYGGGTNKNGGTGGGSGGIYKIYIIRATEYETTNLEATRFLYSLKFANTEDR